MKRHFPCIRNFKSLVTSRGALKAWQAAFDLYCEKQSTPYIEQGKALWSKLTLNTKRCDDILKMAELRPALLLAAGYSVKAQGNMDESDKRSQLKARRLRFAQECK